MPSPSKNHTALQAYFSATTALECAAITAFERLADELEHYNAPTELVTRSRASANDERRHTRMMASLAARHGAVVTPEKPTGGAPRALQAIARENAVEGCVRETYAALLAHWQADHACDPEVAQVYRVIAEDETRHAQLAWDVALWIEPKLDADERVLLDSERVVAVTTLLREMTIAIPSELVRRVGVPDATAASRLIRGLAKHLWHVAN
jgi:hypothetical protein